MINLPPSLLAELAAEHANIVAVKQANDDELGPIEGLEILAGNDDIFARTLGFGGAGGILVASNVAPERMRELYDAAVAGDRDRAAEIDAELKPLYAAMSVAPPTVSAKTGARAARRDRGAGPAADGPGVRRGARVDPRDARGQRLLVATARSLSAAVRICSRSGGWGRSART